METRNQKSWRYFINVLLSSQNGVLTTPVMGSHYDVFLETNRQVYSCL